MRIKATEKDVAHVRAAMHDAVNRICDRWPIIEAIHQGNQGWPERSGENVGGRPKGTHSDPVASMATNLRATGYERDWLILRAETVALLNRADTRAATIVPELPPRICQSCQQTTDGKPSRPLAGSPGLYVHESCRMRARRSKT